MNKDLVLKNNDTIYYKDMFGVNCFHKVHFSNNGKTIKEYEKIKNIKVIKVERTTINVIYETKEILDDVEKEYLSNVIIPFRDRVEFIRKQTDSRGIREYLEIIMKKERSTYLPYFKPNTMYKGMELNKEYTLEELGL